MHHHHPDIGMETGLRAVDGGPIRGGRGGSRVSRLQRSGAMAAAVALHAAALCALVIAVQSTTGAGGTALDAIEVEVVDGSALAARDLRPAAVVTGALGDVAVRDGAGETAPGSTGPPQSAETVTKTAIEPAAQEVAAPPDAEVVTATVDAARRVAADDREREAVAAGSPPAAAGGSGAGGTAVQMHEPSASSAVAAAVAARPGDVRAYTSTVVAALARSKPRATGAKGEARVRFTIDRDGGLETLTLSRSSGSARLDGAALDAVRRATFEAPPPSFGVLERTFEVPYTFR